MPSVPARLLAVAVLVAAAVGVTRAQSGDGFKFKSGVELINVTATVSDSNGRFVSGLQKDDFIVYEDDQRVEVTHFSPERVPVSLGIALDTSGSMAGEKMSEARSALRRFLDDLLDYEDEIFLYRFSNYPVLVEGWTTDRRPVSRALDRITPEVFRPSSYTASAAMSSVPLTTKPRIFRSTPS